MVDPCFPPDVAIFPLAVGGQGEMLGFVGTILIILLVAAGFRSEHYQQSEAHSNKTFVKDSLKCLQRGRNSQQSFVLTQSIET